VKLILESMGLMELLRIYPSKAVAIRELKASVPAPRAAAPVAAAPPSKPGAIRRLFRRLFGHPDDRKI